MVEDARRMRIEIDAHDRNTRRSRKLRHTLGNGRSGPRDYDNTITGVSSCAIFALGGSAIEL